jgi:hypothetical protein
VTELLKVKTENADSVDDGPSCNRRLLNDLGLCWSKDLIRPFRYFFSKYWLDENAMEGPSMKAL